MYRSTESPKRSTAASASSSGTAPGAMGVRVHQGGRTTVLVCFLGGFATTGSVAAAGAGSGATAVAFAAFRGLLAGGSGLAATVAFRGAGVAFPAAAFLTAFTGFADALVFANALVFAGGSVVA